MSQDFNAQLHKENVIPDILPEGSSLSHALIIKWPTVSLDEPGMELDREATQPVPKVYLHPVVCIYFRNSAPSIEILTIGPSPTRSIMIISSS
jgi:hypothetical protein